ncbi:Homeobox protein cut-like 2, partial [Ophiophagus hannah]
MLERSSFPPPEVTSLAVDQVTELGSIYKSFVEVVALSKRTKEAEAAFLSVYKQLLKAPGMDANGPPSSGRLGRGGCALPSLEALLIYSGTLKREGR